jgi:hypothetical protein
MAQFFAAIDRRALAVVFGGSGSAETNVGFAEGLSGLQRPVVAAKIYHERCATGDPSESSNGER